MSYLNARGWLMRSERDILHEAAHALPEHATILNIGVEYGASVTCLREGNPNANIYAIDLSLAKYEGPTDDRIHLIEADSGAFVTQWSQPIHLAFIDGDHGHAGVLRDCQYADHIVSGGLVLFHDCYDWVQGAPFVHRVCPGVASAVEVWAADNRLWNELPPVGSMRIFRKV